jgi:hypothetical protein
MLNRYIGAEEVIRKGEKGKHEMDKEIETTDEERRRRNNGGTFGMVLYLIHFFIPSKALTGIDVQLWRQ